MKRSLAIITGEKDLDYFDEFVTQWKALGGDQIMEEATGNCKKSGLKIAGEKTARCLQNRCLAVIRRKISAHILLRKQGRKILCSQRARILPAKQGGKSSARRELAFCSAKQGRNRLKTGKQISLFMQ